MTEAVLTVDIIGTKGTAKGVRYQATPENTTTGIRWTFSGDLAKALAAKDGWRAITDDPPLDRPFIGCRVGMVNRITGEPMKDMLFLIGGRHIDYAGGPEHWTWNEMNSGNYGIRLTHWRELPDLPTVHMKPQRGLE